MKAKTLPKICPSNAYYGKMTAQRYILFLKITNMFGHVDDFWLFCIDLNCADYPLVAAE